MHRPLHLSTVVVLSLVLGCVSGVAQEDAEDDELVGTSRPGPISDGTAATGGANAALTGNINGSGTGAPGVISGMPVSTAAPCTPNTVVGECEVCDANGQPIKPDIEPNCPPINCGSNAGYELADEPGRTVCYEIVREAGSNSVCAEIGRCATQEEYCGPMSRREALALESNPCAFMDGCTGQTPPRIESLPEGRTCNRSGECQGLGESARCSVQVPSYCPLEDAPDAMLFCDTGMDEGQRYCEYYVQPPFGGTTCESFCADLSLESCDQMNGNRRCCWNNTMPDNCATATEFFHCDGASCDGESCRDQICRCFVP